MNKKRKCIEPPKNVIERIERTLCFINPIYDDDTTDCNPPVMIECRLIDMLDHVFDCKNIRLCCHANGLLINFAEMNIAYDAAKLPNIISFCETVMCADIKTFDGEMVDHIVYRYAIHACLLLLQYHYYITYENDIHRDETS